MCRRARENAKAKKRLYSLIPEYVEDLLALQNYRCAVSGMLLSNREFHRNPFAPSLDQTVPGQGYTVENVRIVAVIVNTAMNGWGEEPFWRMIRETRLTRHVASQQMKSLQTDVG